MKKIHIFESNGLGKAPFALVDSVMLEQKPGDAPCGTSCDYCGTYIVNLFYIKSADGKKSVIGSSCVTKLGDAGLTQMVNSVINNRRREQRQAKRNAIWEANRPIREARERKEAQEQADRMAKTEADYIKAVEILKTRPHPNTFFAKRGKTMLDYLRFFEDQYGKNSFKVMGIVREALA